MDTRVDHDLSLVCLTLTQRVLGQDERVPLDQIINFEAAPNGDMPGGWGGGPAGTIFFDRNTVHGGNQSVRLERYANSAKAFTTVTSVLPIDFKGKKIELRGFIRTQDVSGFAGLWMREDGPHGYEAFDNMESRKVRGTTSWTRYSIVLPLRRAATRLSFGVLVSQTGRAWADDPELLVDGKPLATAANLAGTIHTDPPGEFGGF